MGDNATWARISQTSPGSQRKEQGPRAAFEPSRKLEGPCWHRGLKPQAPADQPQPPAGHPGH
eukprot:1404390-Pyramimonas_sp.AAC.1